MLEENLESHLNRCPLLKQTQSLSRQPFYRKGINAGSDDDEEKEEKSKSDCVFTSEMKRSAVYSMAVPYFLDLIGKIKSVHADVCSTIPDSYRIPEACSIWTNREVDKYSLTIFSSWHSLLVIASIFTQFLFVDLFFR